VSTVDRPSRRDIIASIARVGVSAGVLFGAFALAPLDLSGREVLGVRLAACVILPTLVLGLQILAVARSPYPRLRAVEAVAISFPLLICLFASTYYAMGRANPASFSEVLTRTDALYFTVTIFATVGFGDVVAASQTARIGVTLQMLADLLLIGVIARVLLGTARQRRAALEAAPPGTPGHAFSSPPRSGRRPALGARAGRPRRSPGRRGRGRPG
jgi:voltage-gated potassium channel Kch